MVEKTNYLFSYYKITAMDKFAEKLLSTGMVTFRKPELRGKEWTPDLEVLWKEYEQNPYLFFPEQLTQQSFLRTLELMSKRLDLFVVEPSKKANSTHPVIGLIMAHDKEWFYEPHVKFFNWATDKDIYRTYFSFMEKLRKSPKVAYALFYCFAKDRKSINISDRSLKHGLVDEKRFVKKNGSAEDQYVYILRGSKPLTKETPSLETMIEGVYVGNSVQENNRRRLN